MEHSGPVVPPREPPGSLAGRGSVGIDQAPLAERGEGLALGRRYVGPAVRRDRVPDVVVGRGGVQVAAKDERLVGRAGLVEPPPEPGEPTQLPIVERAADDPTIRCVEADDADPATDGGHHPSLVERVEVVLAEPGGRSGAAVANRPVAEVRDDVRRPDPAGDGDPIPATLAVVDELVAEHPERQLGRVRVCELRLLHQEDVGLRAPQPLLDGIGPGLQRVDVPGRNPHGVRVGETGQPPAIYAGSCRVLTVRSAMLRRQHPATRWTSWLALCSPTRSAITSGR